MFGDTEDVCTNLYCACVSTRSYEHGVCTTCGGAEKPERHFACEFEVWQGDEMVASASGPREDALREAMHYAAQYQQDGPVRVFEVTRTLVMHNAGNEGPGKAQL